MKNLKASMAKSALPGQDEFVVLMLGSGRLSVFFAAIRVVTKLADIIDVFNFGGTDEESQGLQSGHRNGIVLGLDKGIVGWRSCSDITSCRCKFLRIVSSSVVVVLKVKMYSRA